jgi:hypothetical protein
VEELFTLADPLEVRLAKARGQVDSRALTCAKIPALSGATGKEEQSP